jgi:hypothetical protein
VKVPELKYALPSNFEVVSLRQRGGDMMKLRKDVVFAILTTFCLCALMFSVIPIQSGLPYDPWTDINEDGTINMKDVGNVAAQFGTTGDPTKNVNVVNWPQPPLVNDPTYVNVTWNPTGFAYSMEGLFFSTFGYAKMSVFITPVNTSSGDWGSKFLTIEVSTLRWFASPSASTTNGFSQETIDDYNTTMRHYPSSFLVTDPTDARVFDVKGPFCLVGTHPMWSDDHLPPTGYSEGWILLQINWYLRAD